MLSSTLIAIFVTFAVSSHCVSIHNVEYSIDNDKRQIVVHRIDNEPVIVHVLPPQFTTNNDESFDLLHHYPGLVTDQILPSVEMNDQDDNDAAAVFVLLNNGALMRVPVDRVLTNFHVHRHRLVYGQMRAFSVSEFDMVEKIYDGAPIFKDGKLMSVVTCRHDDFVRATVVFPMSGVRARGLVSGHINFDDRVTVESLKPGMSVYGKKQLPYITETPVQLSVKRFAIATHNNRYAYRDMPRSVAIYHNASDISIALVEGEFEVDRLRFDGPLVDVAAAPDRRQNSN